MDSGDDTIAATEATPPEGVGAMLRARRLELGLSQADVAGMVKLQARRIEAMEQERWEELPDGPFLRGFLRNIARALNLDAASLMAGVDESLMRTGSPDSILIPQSAPHGMLPMRSGPADERRGGRTLVYGAFVFALIAALIAWSGTESFDRALVAAKRTIEPSAPRVNAAPVPLSDRTVAPDAPPVSLAPVAGDPVATAGVNAASPQPARPVTTAGELPLLFHFNEPSWVEVRSADGKVLLQQLNAAGSEQKIDGEAPFSIVVGNAKGVALKFRGQPVDLTPYTRDSVARLKLS
jgi:cytoskeleton protein RodZ